MLKKHARTVRLIGENALHKLAHARVAVIGLGGVGSYAAEALLRAGIGHLLLVDGDVVEESNLNRQLFATAETVGMAKAEAAKQRLLSIYADADIDARTLLVDERTIDSLDIAACDYLCDAIDDVRAKLLLIERAHALGVPIISAMGAGNKLGTEPFEIAPIERTSVCPLARTMRKKLKARGLTVTAVFSRELPIVRTENAPGSISFVPAMAGLTMAGRVIRDLIAQDL